MVSKILLGLLLGSSIIGIATLDNTPTTTSNINSQVIEQTVQEPRTIKQIKPIVAPEPVRSVVTPQKEIEVKKVPVAAPNGTYTNTYGNEIPRPYYAPSIPAGATAKCRNGTYSFSQSRRGTCSHNGGVSKWY